MAWRRKVSGSLVAVVGFMLSPLSWWNDAFVNLPLALAFAWIISLFYRPAFGVSLVVGYWLTNVLGLILMQKGAQHALQGQVKYTRRELLKDLAISVVYTVAIVILVRLHVLQPIESYFGKQ